MKLISIEKRKEKQKNIYNYQNSEELVKENTINVLNSN